MIFGKDTAKYCAFCEHGRDLHTNDEMSCVYKGVVDKADTCRKFKYDVLKRDPVKSMPDISFDEKEFSLQD